MHSENASGIYLVKLRKVKFQDYSRWVDNSLVLSRLPPTAKGKQDECFV